MTPACIVAALVVALRSEERTDRAKAVAPTPTVTVTASLPAVTQTPMRVVGDTAVRATAGVQSVAWGTRIVMRCTYPADTGGGSRDDPEYRATYALRIVPRAGEPVIPTTWNPVPGATVRLEADTHLPAAQIATVQLVDGQGVILLELDL